METKNRALLLSGAMLFMAIDSVRATSNMQKIFDKKDNVSTYGTVGLGSNDISARRVVLRSTAEISNEYQALTSLISEYDESYGEVHNSLMTHKRKFEREMAIARSLEIETGDLNRAITDLDKLQRLGFITIERKRSRQLKLMYSISEIKNHYSALLARYGISGTERAADLKVCDRMNRDESMKSSVQKDTNVSKSRKDGIIRSFFRTVKNGVKYQLSRLRWLTFK